MSHISTENSCPHSENKKAPSRTRRLAALSLLVALSISVSGLNAQGEPGDSQTDTSDKTSAPNLVSNVVAESGTQSGDSTATEAQQNKPIRQIVKAAIADINPDLRVVITSGAATVAAGQSATISLEIHAQGLTVAIGAGVLIVLPVHLDSAHTTAPTTGDAAVQYVDNYTIPGTNTTLPHALLIWKLSSNGGVYVPNLMVNYQFENGSTPDGFTLPIQAYIFEAIGISGPSQVGSGVRDTAGHNISNTLTLSASADEVWGVIKSIDSPANVGDQIFTALRERSYADVIADGDAEDNHTIIYHITIESNKAVGQNGRIFMKNIHISDTLSGFLATGVPTAISVNELASGGVKTPITAAITGTTNRQIDFDVPGVDATTFSGSRTFEVSVVFDKDDYSNRYGQTPILTSPHQITNTATLSYTPVTTGSTHFSAASSAEVAFGWVQQKPTLPTLTLNKLLYASATSRNYTLEMAKVWESNSALSAGDESNVTFTLAKVVSCSGPDSSIIITGPGALSRSAKLILNNSASLAQFPNVDPGCYRLYENVGINANVTAANVNPTTGMLVEVTQPNAQGVSQLFVNGIDYTLPSKYVDFTNTANSNGFIKVYTKRQQPFMYPAQYTDFHGVLGLYASATATTPLYKANYSGTDAGGDYVLFEDVPLTTTFYVKDETGDTRWVLRSVELHTGGITPSVPTSGNETVTVANSTLNVYTAFLQSNYGGMRAGKLLQNPDGSFDTTTNFLATYKLYPFNGATCSSTALTEMVNGHPQDVTFALNNRTVAYVGKEFPSGTYCVREVALLSGAVDLSHRYALYQGDNLRVTITAGSYSGELSIANGTSDVIVWPQPANGTADPGIGSDATGVRSENIGVNRHVNTAKFGQLAVRNFNGAGEALGDQFTITKTDFNAITDSWWAAAGSKNITVPDSGDYREFLPAGSYTLTPYNVPADQVLLESMGGDNIVTSATTLNVNIATATMATAVGQPAVGAPGGHLNPGAMNPASVQTVAFVWKFKPRATLIKQRVNSGTSTTASDGMANARFALYILDGANYEFVDTFTPNISSGVIATGNLAAGTYLLAETTLPSSNFVAPSYLTSTTIFPTTAGSAILQTTAEAYLGNYVKKFQVSAADYGDTAASSLTLPQGTLRNIPLNTIVISKRNASDNTGINGAVFTLCATQNCSAGTDPISTNTTAGSAIATFNNLTPGTYYLREANTPAAYVMSGAVLKVEINSDGWPALAWIGTAPPGAVLNPTVASDGSTQNSTALTWTNAVRPDIKFEKQGELLEWNDKGERGSQALSGACFTLRDDSGSYYESDSSGNVSKSNPQPAVPGDAAQICSDTFGNIQLKQINPLEKYYFNEVVVPPIPGSGATAGLSYEPLQVRFSFAWRAAASNPARTAGYYLVRGHDNDKEYPGWWVSQGSESDVYYELMNRVAEYHIELYKLPVKLYDDTSVANGFVADFQDNETSWSDVVIADAKFAVHAYDPNNAPSYRGALVDTIVVGANSMVGSNVGWSKGLPAGRYVIEEIKAARYYGALNVWGVSGSGATKPRGDQSTSVYYQGPNKVPSDIPSTVDTNWIPVTDPRSGTIGQGVVIELGQGSLGTDDPETEVNEGDRQITFANSNRLLPDPSKLASRMVRDFAEKDGFRLNILTGVYERETRLGGIEFDVYPAYRSESGGYIQLPTIDNKPITTVRSSDWNTTELRQAQFMSEYYDISRVFYCSAQPSGSCADWDTYTWDVNTDDTNGDGVEQENERVYRYRNYALNLAPNGSKGATMSHGDVVDGMINWSAPAAAAIKYAYANAYDQWSVVFVEKPKDNGNDCPGNPNALNNYCSPLPSSYEWDPANLPTFGVTMEDRSTAFATYYTNGDSIMGTPSCSSGLGCTDGHRDPEPFSFPNYRGTGYLKVDKFSEVKDEKNENLALTGATFELYAVDPAYADFSTAAGMADSLAHATLLKADKGIAAAQVTIPFTVGPVKTLKLPAGTYLLLEMGVPANYNAYGSFTSVTCPDMNKACSNPEQNHALDRSGNFQTNKAIGPIYVPEATSANHATVVKVIDRLRPSASIINTWSGAVVNASAYTGSYNVSVAAPATWMPTSNPVVSAGNGDPSGKLEFLEDGVYRMDFGGIWNVTEWIPNATAQTDAVTFVVENSRIVTTGTNRPKVGSSYLTQLDKVGDLNSALGVGGNGIWYVANADATHIDIYVNHIAKGQLVVLKGGIDGQGQLTTAPGGLESATFSYDYVSPDSPCNNATCSGTLTWTPADNVNGGARRSLDAGVYKITETAITGTGWLTDGNPVFVSIATAGAVYLTNNPGGTNPGSTQTHPLLPSNTPATFYNVSSSGTFEVKKFSDSAATINLQGAEFDVYPTSDGSTPSGAAVAHVTYSLTTQRYEFTVAAGSYLLRETLAPSGYGLRDDYIPVTVTAGASSKYFGYEHADNVNVKAVLDPVPLKFDVAKETTFPAIGNVGQAGYLPARETRVGSLPMYLWKRVSPGDNTKVNFDLVAPNAGGYVYTLPEGAPSYADGPSVGAARFSIDRPGEYRVTELVAATHSYLMTNCDYKVQGAVLEPNGCGADIAYNVGDVGTLPDTALLGRAASIFVVYDSATNTLVVDKSQPLPDWKPATSTDPTTGNHYGELIVNNPFAGYVVTVQKFDALTGKLVNTAGAGFGQYDTKANALAGGRGAGVPPDVGKQQYLIVNDSGVSAFNPDYTSIVDPRLKEDDNNSTTLVWWIREEAAPTGYLLSDWFGDLIKRVDVDVTSTVAQQYVVQFYDGKATTTALAVLKNIKEGSVGSSSNQVSTSLINSGFSTTYTMQPNALENTIPMLNYQVADGSVSTAAFAFYGPDKATGASTLLQPAPVGTGPMPTYAFSTVRIGRSVAYQSAADLSADWDDGKSAPGSNAHSNPVWARVNGSAWQLLDATKTFTVPTATANYLNIEYTSARPGVDPSPFDHSATPAIYQGDPFVGSYFTPGLIETDVTFDKWVPTYQRPEVSRIDNTVTISATPYDNTVLATATSTASITVPVADRAKIAVGLGCTDVKCDPTQTPDVNQRKFFPGQNAQFTISAMNEDPNLNYTYPVLLAYMDSAMFSMANSGGSAIYTAYVVDKQGVRTPYSGTCHYAEFGSVGSWSFPDITLAPGEKIQLDFTTRISEVLVTPAPVNYAYVTSGVQPLLPSDKYPTGAAIDGDAGCRPSGVISAPGFAHCGDRVYDQSAAGTYPSAANAQWRIDDWNRLNALSGFNPANYGLFVRTEKSDFVINSTGSVTRGKFVKVNNAQFTSSATPLALNLGDEVTFRIAIENGQDNAISPVNSVTNIRVTDVLPFPADGRGTTWSAALRKVWEYKAGSLTLRTSNGTVIPASNYSVYSSDAVSSSVLADVNAWRNGTIVSTPGISATATSFYLSFGAMAAPGSAATNYLLQPGEVLFVEYTMAFNGWQPDHIALLNDNINKVAANNFNVEFQTVNSSQTLGQNIEFNSNTVGVELKANKVAISGHAWEDSNYDGIRQPSETLLANVPVALWRSVAGGAWTQVSAPTGVTFPSVTGANGEYAFTDLESSAGDGTGAIQYRVSFATPATSVWTYTVKDAGSDDTIDSDVYATTSGGSTAGQTAAFTVYSNKTDVDAGMYQLSTISGVVWEDLNDDGLQDDGVVPWPHNVLGTTVTLHGVAASGTVINRNAVVNSDGTFSFGDLLAGNYKVSFNKAAVNASGVTFKWALYQVGGGGNASSDSDANWAAAASGSGTREIDSVDTGDLTLGYASALEHIAAGVVPTVNISGRVWEDTNFNGVQEASEPFLKDVAVALWRYRNGAFTQLTAADVSLGGAFATASAASDGSYAFSGLKWYADGSYQVRFDMPPAAGQPWFRTARQVTSATASSDSDAYAVADATATPPITPGDTALLMSNTLNLDAGYYRLSKITGYVWHDTNKNGVQDSAEPPVTGVVITLWHSVDGGATYTQVSATAASVTTSSTGRYEFNELRPGRYRVLFDKTNISHASLTYQWTTRSAGTDITIDSDADPYVDTGSATSASPLAQVKDIDLTYNLAINNIDGGIVSDLKYLSGHVWEDRNYDAKSDNATADTAWSAVVVNLYYSDDNGVTYGSAPYATAVTDASGNYMFTGPTGDPGAGVSFGTNIAYRIEVVMPTPATGTTIEFTTANAATDDTIDSDVIPVPASNVARCDGITAPMAVDAGLYRLGSLSGLVWEDLNGNGIRDDGTSAWPHNVTATTVQLKGTDATGVVVNQNATVNSATGAFNFSGLKTADAAGYTLSFNKSAVSAPGINFKWTLTGQGNADTDSDAAHTDPQQTTAAKTPIAYSYAGVLTNYDAGLVPYLTISGLAWEDTNYDGVRGSNETMLAQVPLALYQSVNGAAAQLVSAANGFTFPTETAGDGTYRFDGILWSAERNYWVRFGLPTDTTGQPWTRTARSVGNDASIDSDAYQSADTSSTPARVTGDTQQVSATVANLDAGYYRVSKITGYLWYDMDGNGIQDTNEGAVAAVVVTLQRWNGVAWETMTDHPAQTTTASGRYEFTQLRSGSYRVQFDKSAVLNDSKFYYWTLPNAAGATASTDSDATPYVASGTATPADSLAEKQPITLGYNAAAEHIDGGLLPVLKKIEGRVWEDRNYDGLQNGPLDTADELFENSLPDVAVKLYRCDDASASWTLYASTVTDAAGRFSFTGADGNIGAGVEFTTGVSYRVTVLTPQADSFGANYFFTAQQVGSDDSLDSDVAKDDPVDAITGYSSSASTTAPLTAPSNTIAAGLYRLGDITGVVWEDINGDGVRNDGSNITGHDLTTLNVRLVGTDITGASSDRNAVVQADATYSFRSLKAGNYALTFDRTAFDSATPLNSFRWSPAHQGSDSKLDSDAAPLTTQYGVEAEIAQLTLGYASSASYQDAGVVPFIHISGFVWYDDNRDGELNDAETSAPNVTVTLWRAEAKVSGGYYNERVVTSTLTDSDGRYLFDELPYQPAAYYKVAFTNPDTKKHLFTTAGKHHTAVNVVRDAHSNEQLEAHTDYLIYAVMHSENQANAGLRSVEPHVPTGGGIVGSNSVIWGVLLTSGMAGLLSSLWRRKWKNA